MPFDGKRVLAAAACALFGCGSSASSSGTPQATGNSAGDAGSADGGAVPEGGGSGTIMGTAAGAPFTDVKTAYLAGAPDSDATTVVFVFSKPVKCADLGSPGWDTRITDGTQFLEMKAFGQSPGTFTAVTTVTPAPGEAAVNYTRSSTSGTPKESGSSGGTVTLTKLTAKTEASGSFDLAFGADHVAGTFTAVYCPGGHEP